MIRQRTEGPATKAGERRAVERLFHRDLPGGGYVAIEVTPAQVTSDRRVRVVVERRGDRKRRQGHAPPVIIEEPWTAMRGVGDLYRIACDNVAIARGLLRLQRAD
jgi:hypothetical protein